MDSTIYGMWKAMKVGVQLKQDEMCSNYINMFPLVWTILT
jgi:hypothetical protein